MSGVQKRHTKEKHRRKTVRWRSGVALLSERRRLDPTLSNSPLLLLAVQNYRRNRAAYRSHVDRSIAISPNRFNLHFSNLTEQDCLAFFDSPNNTQRNYLSDCGLTFIKPTGIGTVQSLCFPSV